LSTAFLLTPARWSFIGSPGWNGCQFIMQTLHVFTGPTISPEEVLAISPRARIMGPIAHGDLFDPSIRAGDIVLIVDGLFHHSATIRHKEIVGALDRNVVVAGAASIGALRAADLEPLGMIGYGEVFTAYRDGTICDDAEVAVVHAPDGDQRAQTIPMVNARAMLASAVAERMLAHEDLATALRAIRDVYYAERTVGHTLRMLATAGFDELADWLGRRLDDDPSFGDIKKRDAVAALLACNGAGVAAPPAQRGWITSFYRDWHNFFANDPTDSSIRYLDRVRYQQIFHPRFPQVWRKFLEYSSLEPSDGTVGVTLEQRLQQLGASALDPAVVFSPRFDVANPAHRAVLLGEETEHHRATAIAYREAHASFTAEHAGVDPRALHRSVGRSVLSALWDVPAGSLTTEYARRGLRSEQDAVEALALFIVGYLRDIAAERSKVGLRA
uniref:TfuA-like protein n=1 Tax=Nocardia abscessus TaxID=120957 RepID=UPI002455BD0A